MPPRYKKIGNVVYGMPFKDGTYGIRVVKDKIRIYGSEPIIRYKVLTAKEKADVCK